MQAPNKITHFILSLTWPINLCRATNCTKPPAGVSLPSSFTIHGLWPQKELIHGVKRYVKPSLTAYKYCDPSLTLKPESIATRDALGTYWPSVVHMNQQEYFFFWQKQWQKHGTCTTPMFDQEQYFVCAIDLISHLDVKHMLQQAGYYQFCTIILCGNNKLKYAEKIDYSFPSTIIVILLVSALQDKLRLTSNLNLNDSLKF